MYDEIKFLQAYNDVFDESGKVKLCGREKCKDLIIASCALHGGDNKVSYGNAETGMMNIENIQNLRKTIKL